jgi:ELWxxDGT repeat protein
LFFEADDGIHGGELWTSDGTEAGTTMVDDISPGGSYPGSLTDVNGSLFFAADDGIHGGELWTSDGTEAGTTMVADINPAGDSYVGELTVANGTLFLCATDGTHGAELWTSDGTAAGTVMVGDIDPGPADGLSWIDATAVGGTLFFRADDGTHGVELWKSGTLVTSSVPPSISGTPKVGSVLAADPGAWSQPGASFSYAWSADGSSVGSDASTYTPTAADVGKAITVTVTASASGFLDGTATSAPTAPVAPAAGTQIANTAPPVIAGTPQVGSTLTVSGTAWSPADAVTSYQWLANGVPIAGATGATFTLTGGQVGARISVSATGTKSGYTSATVTSASTGVVVVTPLVDTHAKVKRAKRLVKLVVGVGADGVAPVSGTVKIVRDGKLVSKVQVSGGRVVVKLRHQPRGKHVYKITYLGEGPVLRSVQKLHIRI